MRVTGGAGLMPVSRRTPSCALLSSHAALAPRRALSAVLLHNHTANHNRRPIVSTASSASNPVEGAPDTSSAAANGATQTTTTNGTPSSSSSPRATAAAAAAAAASAPLRPAAYLDVSSVPAGDKLTHDGDLVVHGAVARGASITASGDVVILGSCQGTVHAGADLGGAGGPNPGARVVALEFRKARLKIAGVSTLAEAKVTAPGPHAAYVATPGSTQVVQLRPLGRTRPTPSVAALGASFERWKMAYPAAWASMMTGCYALLAGAALIAAPCTTLGLLFDASTVPSSWIRVGGVLFATFGLQYLGTGFGDWRRVAEARQGHVELAASQKAQLEREAAAALAAASGDSRSSSAAPAQQPVGGVNGAATTPVAAGQPPPLGSGVFDDDFWEMSDGEGSSGDDLAPSADSSAAAAAAAAAAPTAINDRRRRSNLLYSSTPFYVASVWSRLALAVAFTALVVARICEPGLLVLAAINAIGAVSMALALRRQWLQHTVGGATSA